MRLEDIRPDMRVAGVVPGGLVTVGAAQSYGPDAVRLTYTDPQGSLAQRVLFRSDEAALAHVHAAGAPFDADPEKFKLAAEAQRIQLAGLYDPMLAVATSNIEPLPHQIRAVYGELLPRTPLRFLLADDPGAGKTIMAGLYIKELLLRDDVKRCLVVAPGGLVEQWQDELFLKFGLSFDILTRESVTAAMHTSVFEKYPLLIARMDQLSRNEDLRAQLEQSEWDLVIVRGRRADARRTRRTRRSGAAGGPRGSRTAGVRRARRPAGVGRCPGRDSSLSRRPESARGGTTR